MNIGQVLRLIRVNKNNSQKEMAEKLGISQNYLSLIESNKKEPSHDKITEIANKLKISKEALLLAASDVPDELNENDKKAFQRLQKNIVSLLIFELTGIIENNA